VSGVASRRLLAAFYGVAGVFHLAWPEPFLSIMPAMVPLPAFIVFATGLCEIAGAAGLLMARWRRLAGSMLAIYAVCVFPANIVHALQAMEAGWPGASFAWHALRLPLQPLIVFWALSTGGWIGDRGPFRPGA
jgi:uncharacterized membrane protein